MGWIGDMSRVKDCLAAHAEKDEEGRYLVRGGRIVTFMGAGDEAAIDDAVEIRVEGQWKPIIPLLYGGLRVTVI
jgi:hypothetical protein